ncbi:MAG: TonB-dependent receptor plug domain-containing protein [Bacteroidota bacterium]
MKPLGLFLLALLFMASCSSSKSTSQTENKEETELAKLEKMAKEKAQKNKMDNFVDLTAYLRTQRGIMIAGDGQNANISIRGISTLQSSEPLFILDNNQIQNYATLFSLVNVQDIKSVQILKDASETGFYGARGANGVIVIKTKRKKG